MRGIQGHKLALVGNTIYIIGGTNQIGQYLEEIYAINTNNWKVSVAAKIKPRAYHSVIVKDNLIYVIGGATSIVVNDNFYFDTRTQIVSEYKNSKATPRQGHCSVLYQGKAYLFGGGTHTNNLGAQIFSAEFEMQPVTTPPSSAAASTSQESPLESDDYILKSIDEQLKKYHTLVQQTSKPMSLNVYRERAIERVASNKYPNIETEITLWQEIGLAAKKLIEANATLNKLLKEDGNKTSETSNTEEAANDVDRKANELKSMSKNYNNTRNLDDEIDNIRQLETDIEKSRSIIDGYQFKINELHKKSDVTEEIRKCKAELESARNNLQNWQKVKKDRKTLNKELKRDLASTNSTLNELEHDLYANKNNINRNQELLEQNERELDEALKKKKELEELLNNVKALGPVYSDFQNTYLDKLKEVKQKIGSVPEHTQTHATQTAEHVYLAKKISREINNLSTKIEALNGTVENNKNALLKAKVDAAQIEDQKNTIAAKMAQLNAQKKKKKAYLSELNKNIQQLTNEIDCLTTKQNNLEKASQIIKSNITDIDNLLKNENATLGSLMEDRKLAEEALKSKRADLVELKNSLKKSFSLFNESLAKFDQLSKDIAAANDVQEKRANEYTDAMANANNAEQDITSRLEKFIALVRNTYCAEYIRENEKLKAELAALKSEENQNSTN